MLAVTKPTTQLITVCAKEHFTLACRNMSQIIINTRLLVDSSTSTHPTHSSRIFSSASVLLYRVWLIEMSHRSSSRTIFSNLNIVRLYRCQEYSCHGNIYTFALPLCFYIFFNNFEIINYLPGCVYIPREHISSIKNVDNMIIFSCNYFNYKNFNFICTDAVTVNSPSMKFCARPVC